MKNKKIDNECNKHNDSDNERNTSLPYLIQVSDDNIEKPVAQKLPGQIPHV